MSTGIIMLVYRLEIILPFGDGNINVGPFCAEVYDKTLRRVTDQYKDWLGHVKEPREDGIKHSIGEDIRCGFIDQVQVDKWCPGGYRYKALKEAGFNIAEYEVPLEKLRIGDTQVVWTESDGKFVRHVEYEMLEELLPVYHDLPRPSDKRDPRIFKEQVKIPFSQRVLNKVRYNL